MRICDPLGEPVLHHHLGQYQLAAVDIVVVWGTIVWVILAVWPHFRWVAAAQVPYFIWVSIATVLQLSITWMNRA